MMDRSYTDFIKSKVDFDSRVGFDIDPSLVNPLLKPHQRDIVQWAIRGGRRAIFAAFGLGKTFMQLETLRLIGRHEGGRQLIIAPLGVRQEFKRDAQKLGFSIRFVRRSEEVAEDGVYITNYESVRDGKLNPALFNAVSLDEASILRGFGGTKTFREFMGLFAGDLKKLDDRIRSEEIKYRFVATATPSPNEYIELLAYSAFLGVMDVSQAKTRFFKRNSEKADQLTIHPHKEQEFWLWIASWAIFVQRPSDLGHDDTGYALPEIRVNWHELPADHSQAGAEKNGQLRMFADASLGVVESAREKRNSLKARVTKAREIIDAEPLNHFLLWHDLESERHEISKAIPEAVAVWGSQDLDQREQTIIEFSDGKHRILAAKPVIAGSGCNFQRFCHRAIFVGIGFKFNDFIQAIHRIQRFLQEDTVIIDIIYTEAERGIRQQLERKWDQHKTLVQNMTEIIKKYGLSHAEMAAELNRAIGVERIVSEGEHYRCINNDTVDETSRMADNSVDLILTSIPFSTQYEYSPNYCDFGHTDTNAHFWQQMDYLIPQLFRVLKPGRIAAIHVKDRIVPGGMTGLGFQTVYPFHLDSIRHFQSHGFGYMGMKTIVTDVVRENNQTYRLGWTEQCKDGSKMGVGMPEYLIILRKPPSDTSNSYADEPVVKNKGEYSRSRWQIDAHGFARSSGERLMTPEELDAIRNEPDFHKRIFRNCKTAMLQQVYDFEHHVKIGEHIDAMGKLPVTFMLLQPPSWSDEVWSDVTRMMTLNASQAQKGLQVHLCPMQFDIADRAITQWTNPGETVFDPFGGLMTVPYRAVKLGRKGVGVELSPAYYADGINYCKAAENELSMPSLFDLMDDGEMLDQAA